MATRKCSMCGAKAEGKKCKMCGYVFPKLLPGVGKKPKKEK